MSVIQIQGPKPVKGEIFVQGSKNGVLPIMAASLLHKGITVLENVPRIQDVYCMMGILKSLGCQITFECHRMVIDATHITSFEISREDMVKMRSSIFIMGPLLARAGQVITYYPGGCSIGKRPIDLHIYALEKLGASFVEKDGKISASVTALTGNQIPLYFPSVGATENALLAAVAAQGSTLITGCAREPEITELCQFLKGMGADIQGMGSGELHVTGPCCFHDSTYRIGGDRIVAGTYLAAALATGGQVTVRGVNDRHMEAELGQMTKIGGKIRIQQDSITLSAGPIRKGTSIRTGPFPQFPTDLQSVMMAVLCFAGSDSLVEERIFEDRFETGEQLKHMGAHIRIHDRWAYIKGKGELRGSRVSAPDLRGGAALTVAALAAQGESRIDQYDYVLRGYEDICKDLKELGADICFCQG